MSIARKISKLLALAKSSNVHEAANAAAHAQRLLTEHRLTLEDLDDAPIGDAWTVALDDDVWLRWTQSWQLELAVILAEHNACCVVVDDETCRLVGSTEEKDVVRVMHKWLCAQIFLLARSSKRALSTPAFIHGVLHTIDERLTEAAKVPSTSTALVSARAHEASRLADEVCDGDVEAEAEIDDVGMFIDGIVTGQAIDLHGFRKSLDK